MPMIITMFIIYGDNDVDVMMILMYDVYGDNDTWCYDDIDAWCLGWYW